MFTTCGREQILQHFCPPRPLLMDGGSGWRPNVVELAPNCPRCASSNTKFCYYNNYSLSQPRYFCKGCRRYWTKGGSLRNVPVGGGCRKNRRAKSSRLPQRQRGACQSSTSPDHNGNDKSVDSCEYSNGDSASHLSETSGADIDLAVVFARFVDQNQSAEREFRTVPAEFRPDDQNYNALAYSSPSYLNQGGREQHNSAFEYLEKPINGGEADHHDMLLEGFPREVKVHDDHVFIEDDVNAFGLQNLLDDEVVQDSLWSDHEAAAALPNFMGCEDESSRTNVISDGNWSSFQDLSGFEVFSRP